MQQWANHYPFHNIYYSFHFISLGPIACQITPIYKFSPNKTCCKGGKETKISITVGIKGQIRSVY